MFNAVLEHAIRKWKRQLPKESFALFDDESKDRLTIIRYVDDILLFGKSLSEAVSMLEFLADVLKTYGLELNIKKTKIQSTVNPSDRDQVCIIEHGVKIIRFTC